MTKIHNKYDNNYNTELKKMSLILDGTETDETKKKSKQLESYLEQRTKLIQEQTEQVAEISKLKTEQKKLLNAASYVREVDKEKKRLTDHNTTHEPRMENFLGKGTGTKWQTDGWTKKAQSHFSTLNNLYQIKVSGSALETTEEQIINTIAYIVSGLKQVDSADFTAKYNAKESDGTKKTKVKDYLTRLQQQEIIKGREKDASGNSLQPTYDFASTYQKYDESTKTWTNYTAPAFNYAEFFEFIELTHNQPFLKDLDSEKQKKVPNPTSWNIFLKGAAWKVKSTNEEIGLEDCGIEIDPAKTTLYKTGQDKQTLSPTAGITGWLELAHSFTYLADNKNKLVDAFTNSPTQQLLSDLKGWNTTDGFITDGTNWTLPEDQDSLTAIKDQLEMEKMGAAVKLVDLKKSIEEKESTLNTKKTETIAQETEIDKLIKEIIAAKRAELKKHNLAKGFAKTDAEDNRRHQHILFTIQDLLNEIRFLENEGNTTLPATSNEENTAYDQLTTILNEVGKTYLVSYFQDLAYVKDSRPNIQQAISRIKAGKYTVDGREEDISNYRDLAKFKEHFAAQEKLVKLSQWELEAKQAIEKALNQDDNAEENLTDWQSTLKALDPTLDDTLITEAWKTKWGSVAKHGKIAEVATLLKKVIGTDGKIKSEFLEEIKQSDATLLDLKTLLQKEPKDIITYIARFVYNQLDDSAEEEKDKQKTQKKRRIAKKLNKSNESELTEAELNDSLYKLEVGELTLDTKFYTADLQELTSQSPPEQNEEKIGFSAHMGKHWWKYGLGIIGTGGLLVAVFWKKIKGWLDSPTEIEEEGTPIKTDEEKAEENE